MPKSFEYWAKRSGVNVADVSCLRPKPLLSVLHDNIQQVLGARRDIFDALHPKSRSYSVMNLKSEAREGANRKTATIDCRDHSITDHSGRCKTTFLFVHATPGWEEG